MTAGTLTGAELVRAFASASEHLTEQAKAIDAINVYPVPDGDTGSNMAATFREAVAHASAAGAAPTAGAAAAIIARGALYGARGNSGVILSQALRGFATAIGDAPVIDAALLASGLRSAAKAAYSAVSQPVEGTMLTVLRAAAEGAERADPLAGAPCIPTLRAALETAEEAEAHTPEQLPALAEAGVTDSGGEGICVILRGLLGALTGQRPPAAVLPERPLATLSSHANEEYGFCTEFVIEPHDAATLDIAALRAMTSAHRSVVIVGDEIASRVHLHSDDPEAVFAAAGVLGRVSRAKAEDMSAQNVKFRASGSGAGAKVAVLAMSPGPGFDALFESLGVAVAHLDDIVKPAAGDIAAAANALGVADVIVLPNHKNVVMAARQAASLARCTLTVVASSSMPQGVAAAIAFDAGQPIDANVDDMTEAMGEVITIEVTRAAADRTADGITVKEGDAIGMVNGRLVAKAGHPVDALIGGLNRLADDGEGLVTIYGGEDVSAAELQRVKEAVSSRFRDATVEAVHGGQAIYTYIASIER